MHRKTLLGTLLLSVITLGLVACLGQDENIQSSNTSAKQNTSATSTTSASPNTTLPTASGLTVAVDASTGKLRAPTAEERQTLRFQEQQLQQTAGSEALEEKPLADGGMMIDLKGQFQHQIEVEVVPKSNK